MKFAARRKIKLSKIHFYDLHAPFSKALLRAEILIKSMLVSKKCVFVCSKKGAQSYRII